jgi:hypothetical protein
LLAAVLRNSAVIRRQNCHAVTNASKFSARALLGHRSLPSTARYTALAHQLQLLKNAHV